MKSNDKIIEEFREKFDELYKYKPDFSPENDDEYIEASKEVEQFILQALNQKEREVREEIEKRKVKYSLYVRNHGMPSHSRLTLTNASREGYNQAIDDILRHLKQPKE